MYRLSHYSYHPDSGAIRDQIHATAPRKGAEQLTEENGHVEITVTCWDTMDVVPGPPEGRPLLCSWEEAVRGLKKKKAATCEASRMLERGREHRKKTPWVLHRQLRQRYFGLLGGHCQHLPWACQINVYACLTLIMAAWYAVTRLRWESRGAYLNQPFVWHSTETWKHLMMDILNQTAGIVIKKKSNGIPETSGYLLR